MVAPFVHDAPSQRIVYGIGAVRRVREEAERLNAGRVLVIATPGSGARLGGQVVDLLAERAAGCTRRP